MNLLCLPVILSRRDWGVGMLKSCCQSCLLQDLEEGGGFCSCPGDWWLESPPGVSWGVLFDFWQPGCGVTVIGIWGFFNREVVSLVESLRTKRWGASRVRFQGPGRSFWQRLWCACLSPHSWDELSFPSHCTWETLQTTEREQLNPEINDLRGEIKGTEVLHNKEEIERRCCCKEETENQTNSCRVGKITSSQSEQRSLVRCWHSLLTVRAVRCWVMSWEGCSVFVIRVG